jgi:hypothetical protein
MFEKSLPRGYYVELNGTLYKVSTDQGVRKAIDTMLASGIRSVPQRKWTGKEWIEAGSLVSDLQ